jgi:hypothetical protein
MHYNPFDNTNIMISKYHERLSAVFDTLSGWTTLTGCGQGVDLKNI